MQANVTAEVKPSVRIHVNGTAFNIPSGSQKISIELIRNPFIYGADLKQASKFKAQKAESTATSPRDEIKQKGKRGRKSHHEVKQDIEHFQMTFNLPGKHGRYENKTITVFGACGEAELELGELKIDLPNHVEYLGSKKFRCMDCWNVFNNLRSFKWHLKIIHGYSDKVEVISDSEERKSTKFKKKKKLAATKGSENQRPDASCSNLQSNTDFSVLKTILKPTVLDSDFLQMHDSKDVMEDPNLSMPGSIKTETIGNENDARKATKDEVRGVSEIVLPCSAPKEVVITDESGAKRRQLECPICKQLHTSKQAVGLNPSIQSNHILVLAHLCQCMVGSYASLSVCHQNYQITKFDMEMNIHNI